MKKVLSFVVIAAVAGVGLSFFEDRSARAESNHDAGHPGVSENNHDAGHKNAVDHHDGGHRNVVDHHDGGHRNAVDHHDAGH
jgi:hypothetical protein